MGYRIFGRFVSIPCRKSRPPHRLGPKKRTIRFRPCVVIGQVSAESSEFFKFTVAAGQRLSFEVLGRRLGSALDPWIKLYDAKSGRELRCTLIVTMPRGCKPIRG